ncbi:DUF1349 domain-containing protein [Arthrobacter cheniae]|uniref:DUF1349 domain-containing protein n=1 Tax=Arthrobacter cheniae TaxID=1258888 RepID=UPI002E261769
MWGLAGAAPVSAERAHVDDEPWRLVRVALLVADATVTAGSFCCASTSADFAVHFTSWRITPPGASLHPRPNP